MLQIHLFGELNMQAHASARQITGLRTLKATSLLGYLILHPNYPHSREQMAEMFWPGRPPANARRSLHTALWQIRRAVQEAGTLDGELLHATAHAVTWNAAAVETWLDVAEFERSCAGNTLEDLQRATALYTGPLLLNLYDDWCLAERRRLEEKFLQAQAELSGRLYQSGDYAHALEIARRALQVNALDERAHLLTMQSLASLGDRAAAIEQYRTCVDLLKTELAVQPSESIQKMYRQLVQGPSVSLLAVHPEGVDTPALLPTVAASSAAPFSDLPEPPFSGREQECADLQCWWQNREAPIAWVSGESGVGKTRLAWEFAARQLQAGARVAWVSCYASDQHIAYQAIRDMLRDLLVPGNEVAPPAHTRRKQPVLAAAAPALPTWLAGEIAQLLPEWNPTLSGEPALAQSLPDPGRIFDMIMALLQALAERQPVLLVMDDLHWGARITHQLVEYLSRRLAAPATRPPHPIRLLALTTGEGNLPKSLTLLFLRLGHAGLCLHLPLACLDKAQICRWIGIWSRQGRRVQALAGQLYQRTEGNPFFITEIVKTLFIAGSLRKSSQGWEGTVQGIHALPLPSSISNLIKNRMHDLSSPAAELAQAAAVAGQQFNGQLIQSVVGLTGEQAMPLFEELLSASLIQESDTRKPDSEIYTFAHQLIRDAIYQQMHQVRRVIFHRRIARILEERLGESAAASLFYHYHCAHDWDAAARWGVCAAQQALRMTAFRDALDLFSQVEGIPEQAHLPAVIEIEWLAGMAEAYAALNAPIPVRQYAQRLKNLSFREAHKLGQIEAALWLGVASALERQPQAQSLLEDAGKLALESPHPRLLEILLRLTRLDALDKSYERQFARLRQAVTASLMM